LPTFLANHLASLKWLRGQDHADSTPPAFDGKLGNKNSPDGARGWAPINNAAKPNAYIRMGDSKR
jgi:hypothetical protein